MANPDLKPQQKKTIEVDFQQALGPVFRLSASSFYSRFTNLVRDSDVDQSYAGYRQDVTVCILVRLGNITSLNQPTARVGFLAHK